MPIKLFVSIFLAAGTLCQSLGVSAELSNDQHYEIVNTISQRLDLNYVFPDLAKAMSTYIQDRQQQGVYRQLRDEEFAQVLTEDLRSISHDRHIVVRNPQLQNGSGEQISRSPRATAPFVTAEVLDGNIGYLKVTVFAPIPELREDLVVATQTIFATDALIIDVRDNPGGLPASVMLLAGYLIPEKTLIAQVYSRPGDSTMEMWTSVVDGPHYSGEVWALTSKKTFSAAEAFVYHLKHFGRLKVVGEATGGGAHRIMPEPLPYGFIMAMPFTRPINMITKGDWEGVGVLPDITVRAEEAFEAAKALATKSSNPIKF